jgi:Lipocalin-like domain
MKKQLLFLLAIITAIVIYLPACQKDDPATPATKTEIVTRSPWVFQSATASGTDVSNTPQLACFKDNIITFSSNGNYTVNEGAVICAPSTAGTNTWSFQTNETQLVLAAALFPGGSGTFDIITLNETNLVVSQNVTIPPSPTAIQVIFTFKH